MPTKRKPKTTNASIRRVIAYVRISRAREDENSTKDQERVIRQYCSLHGWQIIDVIVEPGRSAWKDGRASRPGFLRAMELIESGAADTFVVWKLDRAARNTLDLLTFVKELESHGAEFVSVTEHFDTTTPMGRAMMTIVAALAELESAQKSERATEWHEGRRLDKRVPAGPPVLGYRRELDEDEQPIPNTLVLDEVVAPLVRHAAARVLAGDSINAITQWLNDSGVSITRPGLIGALRSATIAGLLSTEPLGGELIDPTTLVKGGWEPLLDEDTWHTIRHLLADPDRRTNKTNVLQHPLRPLMRCHCGGAMRRQGDNRKYQAPRYVCVEPKCLNGITQGPVDEEVTKTVLDHLDDGAWRSLRATGRPSGPDPDQVDADLKRMWGFVISRDIDMEEYVEFKLKLRGEQAAAMSPLNELPDVESVREAWDSFTPQQKHLVLRRAIKSLVIKPSTRRGRGVDTARIDLELVD